ncbi:Cysteine desulfurase [Seminavis robusta]|uniref:Cysteine desulfurase n=1 Tax=Seminavis robusta TaxID=568900 RepID=A0A9N8EDI3_9STRA|nr:Cysteine desulfurase [Seminavis robusta]|eukprot:Sro785_g202120.1 Cysteine desulfurase (973) ;mRNA; r:18194-21112
MEKAKYRYSVSGSAAHTRLVPLLPSDWEDCSPTKETPSGNEETLVPDFVWENGPRKATRPYRDILKAYSHLPNGSACLDSKWVLARLLNEDAETSIDKNDNAFSFLATLESHCFKGPDGYASFCQRVFTEKEDGLSEESDEPGIFPDLLINNGACPSTVPPSPSSLWVVKDAFSNGAGGIWVVDSSTSNALNKTPNASGPLYQNHQYVAQRYTWPPVLYGGKKMHVRVYGLLTSDGRAFVHKRAFLHVANDKFQLKEDPNKEENEDHSKIPDDNCLPAEKVFRGTVHISNCCANSHDQTAFAGEILADLEATDMAVDKETEQPIYPLGPFFPSMKASLAALTQRAWPFLAGGQGNNGFEYLGMDFILSYKQSDSTNEREPVAYLLEVNAPPAQDTATGLKHAEDLHDDVIRDIMTLWVLPKVTDGVYAETPGGWRLAHTVPSEGDNTENDEPILPSKAAIINKIRWGMLERRTTKQESRHTTTEKASALSSRYVNSQDPTESHSPDFIAARTRNLFPYFSDFPGIAAEATSSEAASRVPPKIFWENAGGAQVPFHVIRQMTGALGHRNRSVEGAMTKERARNVLGTLLGAAPDDYFVFLGPNASTLLLSLANQYASSGMIKNGDEIVLSTENHLANVNPWIAAAEMVGATIKWWAPTRFGEETKQDESASPFLSDILTKKTRIIAISHASNILGQLRDVRSIRTMADSATKGYALLVVDAVAAAPHIYPNVSSLGVDWYVVSCHKLFGPHIGALLGRKASVDQLVTASMTNHHSIESLPYKLLEVGTINYEGCSGIVGLGMYIRELGMLQLSQGSDGAIWRDEQTSCQTPRQESYWCPLVSDAESPTQDQVMIAYQRIRRVEEWLVDCLLTVLRKSDKVRIIEIPESELFCVARLPVISFVHETVKSSTIVECCSKNGLICRHGTFLSNLQLLEDFGVSVPEGVVRVSLLHYNLRIEVDAFADILESIPGWF